MISITLTIGKHYTSDQKIIFLLVLNKHKLQILWNNMNTFTFFLSFFLICLWRKTLLVMREHIVIIFPRNWNTKGTINLVKLIIWAENVIMKTIRMFKYQLQAFVDVELLQNTLVKFSAKNLHQNCFVKWLVLNALNN